MSELPIRRCGQQHSAISCNACELTDEVERLRQLAAELAAGAADDCAEIERLRGDRREMGADDVEAISARAERAEARLERVVREAGRFHDLFHAPWRKTSAPWPECDCALSTALAAAEGGHGD